MTLHVEIKINHQRIGGVHIGRTEILNKETDEYTYVVTNELVFDPIYAYQPNWSKGYEFRHTYSDGVLVCIRKAIQALEENYVSI